MRNEELREESIGEGSVFSVHRFVFLVPRLPLCSWMGFVVHMHKMVEIDMGIFLRCR